MPHELLTDEIVEKAARAAHACPGCQVPRCKCWSSEVGYIRLALLAALPDLEAAWNRRAPLSDEQDITFGR